MLKTASNIVSMRSSLLNYFKEKGTEYLSLPLGKEVILPKEDDRKKTCIENVCFYVD
jgi:hypothetical protein